MTSVAVILPCYGRYEQTLRHAARLRAVCGDVAASWFAVGGRNEGVLLVTLTGQGWSVRTAKAARLTYWQALERATAASDAPILCAVANDVWAGENWLQRGLEAYQQRFPDGEGLLGFSGDGHGVSHSCHFLIGRRLLAALGGWPTWYAHNFGDTELCLRAQALGRYGKARHAVLEHRHVWHGTAPDDAVYQAGRARWAEDETLFLQRKEGDWK